MTTAVRPFRTAQWGQCLALVLAGALLLQGGPMRVLVQAAGQAGADKTCQHHAQQEVCPRNPDGPCTCMHHDTQDPSSEAGDSTGPVFEACDGGGANALSPSLSPLSRPPATSRLGPRSFENSYAPLHLSVSPQRVGDDVFRPPRTRSDVRLS